jgi:hypothetical protein
MEGVNKLINSSNPCTSNLVKFLKDVDENGAKIFNLQNSDTSGASRFGKVSPSCEFSFPAIMMVYHGF